MPVISKSQYKEAAKGERKPTIEAEEKSSGITSKSRKVSREPQEVSAIGTVTEEKKPKTSRSQVFQREEQERSVGVGAEEKSVGATNKPPRRKKSNCNNTLVTNEERSVSMSRHRPRTSPSATSKVTEASQGSRSKVERKLRSFHQAVKRFVSTPIPEEKLRNLANTIQRKVRKTNPIEIIKTSKRGEDVYVTKENRTAIRENQLVEEPKPPVENTPPPMAKDRIYIHGRPFWFFPSTAPTDEDLKGVDDTLEFNSKTILAVGDGRIKLKPMPTPKIIMDPLADLDVIKEKDAVYFQRDIVFSNTFRSMIYPWSNPSSSSRDDHLTPSTLSSSKSKSFDNLAVVIIERPVKIEEPSTVTFYKRKQRDLRRVEQFVHRKTIRM